ncbi:MAG: 3-deoxy-7-phosphoheptulonate synthase [Treponema sp.]|jgi:3-deoxy-7-phosphoheptulonate synthase|nr:3-deoxy-7-phosphoheptulonate synthase [Treponema sp.]
MIVVLSKSVSAHDRELVGVYLRDHGFTVREQSLGDDAVLGASGKGTVDMRELGLFPGVERVAATSRPYELASREVHHEDTIVAVPASPFGGDAGAAFRSAVKIGGSRITVIAGPCAVESREQILETAMRVRESGAVMLRGGAYKPRTSPYAFQGLGLQGLEYMKLAGEACGMPIVTEVVSPELAVQMKELTDMFQIGARNMQNFELLKKVGSLGKPVLLKRGPSATMEEWLLSAEYLLASGTSDVVLCERGIRTFETYTRNTLDISAIPVVKSLSHLPVIVDPSHAVGIRDKVSQAALAAIAAGADGLTVEVHPRPDEALSDGPQSLYPQQFEKLMRDIEALAPVVGKELLRTPRPHHGKTSPGGTAALRTDGGEASPGGGSSACPVPQAERPGVSSELPVAFCGENGAYAEQALMRAFGEEAERFQASSFTGVFDAVLDGSAAAGVVPVENSLAGSVHENYDLFLRYPDIAIAGEIKLRIVHCLIACDKADVDSIRVVRSHPQGFAQCREFLDKHPSWVLEPSTTTATAVASVSREGNVHAAAIAGEAAARAHGLKVLREGIETNPLNYTRFLIITRRRERDGGPAAGQGMVPPSLGSDPPNKASIVFSVPDEPGSLFACLKIMAERGINLSKLESRPIQGRPWEYLFYADVSIPGTGTAFDEVIEALRAKTRDFHFLGAYRGSL